MPGPWQEKAAEHEAFINLAGSSIFGRWNDRVKKEMRESRIRTTDHVVTAMARGKGGKKRLLSASAIGYYGFRGDEPLDENALPGHDFLASLSVEWEAAASNARKLGAMVTICRFGIVLGKKGGVLQKLVPLFKSSLGTSLGRGDQWMSWIHEIDLADILLFLLDQPDLEGPINCTAPNPVRNREMTRTLAEVLGARTLLPPVPGFMVQLLMGEFGNVILKGQKVLPRRLLERGFPFRFPNLKEALADILKMRSERDARSLVPDERANAK
jgi:uncharacterized protein (TIGR01777 family)